MAQRSASTSASTGGYFGSLGWRHRPMPGPCPTTGLVCFFAFLCLPQPYTKLTTADRSIGLSIKSICSRRRLPALSTLLLRRGWWPTPQCRWRRWWRPPRRRRRRGPPDAGGSVHIWVLEGCLEGGVGPHYMESNLHKVRKDMHVHIHVRTHARTYPHPPHLLVGEAQHGAHGPLRVLPDLSVCTCLCVCIFV